MKMISRQTWKPARTLFITSLLLMSVGCATRIELSSQPARALLLNPDDRIMVLAPHPDDETLTCGGLIQKSKALGLPVRVVFFTYGDNNELSFLLRKKHPVLIPESVRAMGKMRHEEAINACSVLGVEKDDLIFLGYPDFGTLNIWLRHWGETPPFRSMLTRAREVTYQTALRPGALYKGEEILKDLTTVLEEFHPTKIFLSHAADTNPDHRALHLFTKVAIWNLENDNSPPEILPYLTHYGRWPEPKAYKPEHDLVPPAFFDRHIEWRKIDLSEEMTEIKYKALQQHKSQIAYSRKYMQSFVRKNELFGDFPDINFTGKQRESIICLDENDNEILPDNLTPEEEENFTGINARSFSIERDKIVITLRFSRKREKLLSTEFFCFGYRHDKDFADMPKIRIVEYFLKTSVFDGNKKIQPGLIEIARSPMETTVKIPLSLLGNPEKALTSSRTYFGENYSDQVSWRIINLK